MWWIMLGGCSPDEDQQPDDDVSNGTVECEAQPDNTLRVDCTITLPSEAAITLTATDPDGDVVTVDGPTATEATLTLWGLRPETAYDVAVDDVSTTFTTGALPDDLAALTVEVTGSTTLDAVAQLVSCAGGSYVVVLDPTGTVRWYQSTTADVPPQNGGGVVLGGGIGGFSLTDDPGFVVLTEGAIRDWSVTGVPGVTIDPASHALPLHHDLAQAGDDTLALFMETITGPDGLDYMIDGVAVFDADGALVETWHLADHIDPAQLVAGGGPPEGMGGPGGPDGPNEVDWSHANGITVTEDGDWIVSFRWLSAIYRIDGHRGSPTFGEVEWTAVGDPASPIPSSFVIDADGAFLGQHHGTVVGDTLTVFDNRTRPDESRTVTLRLDPGAGTATTVETHRVGETCDVEGGAVPLPDGGVFATCATSGIGSEFPAGSGDTPTFTIHASCGAAGQGPGSPRIVPFTLP